MSELQARRRRIGELDAEILRLVAERMQHARAVGAIKKARAVPLRDWEVEKQVLARSARTAAALGLAPELARTLMRALIAASRCEQERVSYSAYRGRAERILIIGGLGRMGRWFADFFANQGHRVEIHDPRAGPDAPRRLAPGLERSSCALVATPLETVPRVIGRLSARRYGGLVFDIASLKGHLRPAIERARDRGLSIASCHPMFGPRARTLSDKVVCLCDCGDAAALRRLAGFFRDTAARLVKLSLEEHDRIICHVLGLSHLINILFTRVLAASGLECRRLRQVASTTFLSQMATTVTVIREDPALYYAIQRHNAYTRGLYARLERAWRELSGWVLRGEREAFLAGMLQGRRWVNGDDAG